jgi:glycosyltransferase involved in cell wall biosynthesis
LKVLATALRYLFDTFNVRIVAIGANACQFGDLPIEVVNWTENTEVAEILKFDIGIMPLPDEPFERGKCGYKLIQYMACGKPVVASPVGVNVSIVEPGVNGFLASTVDDWKKYLGLLCVDSMLRRRLGSAGRNIVEKSYSLNVTAPRLEMLLKAAERVNVRI